MSTAWVAERVLHYVSPPMPEARLAAPWKEASANFGMTKEICTVLDYSLPQAWAVAWHQHGLAGVRYELRHDPRARPTGVALFGPAGCPEWPSSPGDRCEPIAATALGKAGVVVLPVPFSSEVTVLPR